MKKTNLGFTLIELLVTISIVGILATMVIFGLEQGRQSARDGRRKADLENIASALELYRSECSIYPPNSSVTFGNPLNGTGTGTCVGQYMGRLPNDPQGGRSYFYRQMGGGSSFVLCAALEQPPTGSSGTGCGSCGVTCNYRISYP